MRISADTWLRDLSRSWAARPTDLALARAHRDAIDHRLRADPGIVELREIGSLGHGTAVTRYSAVDCLAVMRGARPTSHWTAFEQVRASLSARFPQLAVEIRQPAVLCPFEDGAVEVLPAYPHDRGFWIPDPTGEWMTAYPAEQHRWLEEVDARHGGGLKSLARQLKVWKYRRHVPVSSSYLEMAAGKRLAGQDAYAPLVDLAAVLERLHAQRLAPISDPTGLGSRFTAYSSVAKHAEALAKLANAESRARRAREQAEGEDDGGAVAELQVLFDQRGLTGATPSSAA